MALFSTDEHSFAQCENLVTNPLKVVVCHGFSDGVLNASFETQSQAARHAVAQDLSSLKVALEEQGIEVGEFSVNVEQGQTQSRSFSETTGGSYGSSGDYDSSAVTEGVEEESYDILAEQRRIMAGSSVLDLIA